MGHLLLRYLFGLGFAEASAPHFRSCFQAQSGPAIRSILDELGLPLSEQVLHDFARESSDKNAVIFPLKARIVLDPSHFRDEPQAAAGRRNPGVPERVRNLLRGISRALTGPSTP